MRQLLVGLSVKSQQSVLSCEVTTFFDKYYFQGNALRNCQSATKSYGGAINNTQSLTLSPPLDS